MLSLRKPSKQTIDEFLRAQSQLAFAYPNVGTLMENHPPGFTFNAARAELGSGEAIFQRAVEALRRWEQFRVGWVELCWTDAPLEVGTTVAILARTFGLWSLSACRIIQVIEESPVDQIRQFGFIYATLPDHPEIGEERFAVEWCLNTDTVYYDVSACFRPHDLIVRFGWLYFRKMVDRFREQSAASMQRACEWNPAETAGRS